MDHLTFLTKLLADGGDVDGLCRRCHGAGCRVVEVNVDAVAAVEVDGIIKLPGGSASCSGWDCST